MLLQAIPVTEFKVTGGLRKKLDILRQLRPNWGVDLVMEECQTRVRLQIYDKCLVGASYLDLIDVRTLSFPCYEQEHLFVNPMDWVNFQIAVITRRFGVRPATA